MTNKVLPEGKLNSELLSGCLSELPTDEDVVIKPGIGIDAGGIKVRSEYISIAADPITFAAENIGHYSVAVNINDVVCQGCRPRWYAASLLLPLGTTEKDLKEYWQDLVQALNRWQITAVAGHTEVTDAVERPLLCGQIMGEPLGEKLISPEGAKAGQAIYQWRPAALEGLALLTCEYEKKLTAWLDSETVDQLKKLLDDPGICVWPDSRKLFNYGEPVALHDPTEGGVATAIHELADAAGCGVRGDAAAIKWPDKAEKLFSGLSIDPLGLLSSGCLLVVYDASFEPPSVLGLNKIGELTEEKERIMIDTAGEKNPLPRYSQDQLLKAFKIMEE